MPTDVVMPQMGESITEGTITKWLKKPGDSVQRDEPLFEISTDKVDAEIPSPAAGTLKEIKIGEGTTVTINTVVAVIDAGGAASASAPAKAATAAAEPPIDSVTPPAVDAPATTFANPAEADSAAAGTIIEAGGGTEVLMPQMGESITEGTITKWLKKVGDSVQRDEPIFEISTDKVDAEIPSPAAGTLTEIKVPEGSTVTINTVVAVIGGGAAKAAAAPAKAAPAAAPAAAAPAAAAPAAAASASAGERGRSSPLVRKIAQENNVDLSQVAGTGSAGRITKEDILGHLEGGAKPAAAAAPAAAAPAPAAAKPAAPASAAAARRARPHDQDALHHRAAHGRVQAHLAARPHRLQGRHDPHRQAAREGEEQVRAAQRRQAHLHAVHHPRRHRRAAQAPRGQRCRPGRRHPLQQEHQHRHRRRAGLGPDRPRLKQTEEKNFLGIARGIVDVAERARSKKLAPDEVSGGTFTLTNSGIFGEQFGTPIINQPQVAILGIGGLNKEAEVITDKDGNDSIAIRSIQRFTLGFDHRIVDGADAGKFMSDFKAYLENWSEDIG